MTMGRRRAAGELAAEPGVIEEDRRMEEKRKRSVLTQLAPTGDDRAGHSPLRRRD
jgi:hypothetical protein